MQAVARCSSGVPALSEAIRIFKHEDIHQRNMWADTMHLSQQRNFR